MDRRHVVLGSLAAFATATLVREARAVAPADRRLSARRWVDRQEEMARALHAGTLSQVQWHDAVNGLAREVDVAQLMAEIRRSRIPSAGEPFMRDPRKRNIRFLDDAGQPRRLTYAAALFDFTPANVITPHAHRHMASAHMVVEGKVRIRTFDRLGEEPGRLLIRPAGDHVAEVGQAAAMTTAKDNVHWFTPRSSRAATFDVIISDLDPGQPGYDIQPVDPLGGEQRPDGSIAAPLMSFEASMNRYTPAV